MSPRTTRAALIGTIFMLVALIAPTGAVAAPAVSSVSIAVYACPASIQTPEDLVNAGGASAACAIAGRPGDFGTLPPGFTWEIDPIEYDLESSIATSDGSVQTDPEATAGGFCNTTTMTCHAYQAYGWFNLASGKMTVTEDAAPTGYSFGWADVSIGGKAARSTLDAATSSVSFRAHPNTQNVLVLLINIVP
jgi:hypothetical protein